MFFEGQGSGTAITTPLFSSTLERLGDIQLDGYIFNGKINRSLMNLYVRWQMAARRAGTASTKGRWEVRGGGRKPWKQKKTGMTKGVS